MRKPRASRADPGQIAADFIDENKIDRLATLRHWNGSYLRWSNGRYVEVPDGEVRAEIVNYFDRSWSHIRGAQVSNVLEHVRAKTILASEVTSPAWLAEPPIGFEPHDCLATANRIIHLPSFVDGREPLDSPATPALFTTTACDFDLDLNAPEPTEWLEFLRTLWPDDQHSIETLQEIFGYLLTADTRQQKIFLLVGPPRSGKGTIARVLRQLVGEGNVAGPTLSGLATNFGPSALVGRSVATVSDARLSGRADQAVVVERLLTNQRGG